MHAHHVRSHARIHAHTHETCQARRGPLEPRLISILAATCPLGGPPGGYVNPRGGAKGHAGEENTRGHEVPYADLRAQHFDELPYPLDIGPIPAWYPTTGKSPRRRYSRGDAAVPAWYPCLSFPHAPLDLVVEPWNSGPVVIIDTIEVEFKRPLPAGGHVTGGTRLEKAHGRGLCKEWWILVA